jgi:hypothetical protein
LLLFAHRACPAAADPTSDDFQRLMKDAAAVAPLAVGYEQLRALRQEVRPLAAQAGACRKWQPGRMPAWRALQFCYSRTKLYPPQIAGVDDLLSSEQDQDMRILAEDERAALMQQVRNV